MQFGTGPAASNCTASAASHRAPASHCASASASDHSGADHHDDDCADHDDHRADHHDHRADNDIGATRRVGRGVRS